MFQADNGDRPEAPNVLLVITDGRAKDDNRVITQSQLLRDDGVVVSQNVSITQEQIYLDPVLLRTMYVDVKTKKTVSPLYLNRLSCSFRLLMKVVKFVVVSFHFIA